MSPRVSVIIATYNWSSVLPYSIGSVLRQTMTDFEVLVVGDGCTDDSEQVVASIGDPRVRWINLPENTKHQSGPNNEGLRQARGELIAYLGHDDLWLPHHLEAHLRAIDASGADLSHSVFAMVFPNGDAWPMGWDRAIGPGPPTSVVHRRTVTEALGGWTDYRDLTIGPEIDLWRRARAAGFEFTLVRRFTAIKFPASFRKDVYRSRPSHEQAAWSERISSERDFEVSQLIAMLTSSQAKRMSYGQLVRQLLGETFLRLPRWISQPSRHLLGRYADSIDETRKFKGL